MVEVFWKNNDEIKVSGETNIPKPEDFAKQIQNWKVEAKKAEANDPDWIYNPEKLDGMFNAQFSNISYNPDSKTAWLEDVYKKIKRSLSSDPTKNIAKSYEKRGFWDGDREKQISWVFKWEKIASI